MWSNRSLVKRRFLLAFWLLYLKPVLKYTVWERNTEWSHGHWNACWDDKCNLLRILHREEHGLIFLLTQNLSYNMSICKFFFSIQFTVSLNYLSSSINCRLFHMPDIPRHHLRHQGTCGTFLQKFPVPWL